MSGCLLLHPNVTSLDKKYNRSPESALVELQLLAKSISLEIFSSIVVNLSKIHISHYFGKGKVTEIKCLINKFSDKNCLIIINSALSPIQHRNLEQSLNRKVLDRTALILEIFGSRANTKEGSLQVELAHLEWQKSRLVRSWTHLERQRGGRGFMGGPGELQIELDKRIINTRIKKIKFDLKKIIKTRTLHRKKRKSAFPIVSLIGYTNTGKSTLFNLLTGASEYSKNLLFATLNSKHRKASEYKGLKEFILSDTVGFVSNLPTELIESFKGTLEEIVVSDLIIHVRDISHGDYYSQNLDVKEIINKIFDKNNTKIPNVIEVLNKIDKSDHINNYKILNSDVCKTNKVYISAKKGLGIYELRKYINKVLNPEKSYI